MMARNWSPRDDEIVGHKTFSDGKGGFRHEPLTRDEADALMKSIDDARNLRVARMPDEKSAIRFMFDAWLRLKELGWREAIYCPKDGSSFNVIEAGSTGIHRCHHGNDSWWIEADNDVWPAHPILFKAIDT